MKKFALLLLGGVTLMGCESVNIDDAIMDENQNGSFLPSTEVFVSGRAFSYMMGTKGAYAAPYISEKAYAWPYTDNEENWESARFSIRIDNSLPGYTNQAKELYWGRHASSTGKITGKNGGKVSTSYPYGHYNDRNFDYYKRDRVTGNNIGMFRYVYDEKGLQTQLAILEKPSVVDILSDEVDDIQAELNANKNVAINTQRLQTLNNFIALGKDYLDSHVAWYVVKEVGGDRLWHVNGVITDTVVGKPDRVPNDIEIDIHQQQHVDWNEIKTSVHIRADVDSVEINIPLSVDEMVEQDDFDIRIFKDYLSSDADFSSAEIIITHNDKGITIVIRNIDFEAIKRYKSEFGDGLTVEIFSYTTSNNTSKVWDEVKKSRLVSLGKSCTVKGQITSAFYEDTVGIFAPYKE